LRPEKWRETPLCEQFELAGFTHRGHKMDSKMDRECKRAFHPQVQYQAIVRDTDDKKPRAYPDGYANGFLF